MKLKTLHLENIGPFFGTHSINFHNTTKPIILVGALNGGGKTTDIPMDENEDYADDMFVLVTFLPLGDDLAHKVRRPARLWCPAASTIFICRLAYFSRRLAPLPPPRS